MTAEQTRDLQRATQRAHSDHIRVVDDYGDGLDRVWKVTSSAGLFGQDYTVTLRDAQTLACTCRAGQHGMYCKHRAAVHDYLLRERVREHQRTGARRRAA
jgi:SWIM zinc finger